MGGWGYMPPRDPGIKLPAGIRVATVGARIGAWFLDSLIVGFLMIVPAIGAIVTGAVGLNQAALDQVDTYSSRPFDAVTAPLLHVDTSLLAFWGAVFVAISALYYILSWVKAGATPAQRALKVRVVDLADGSNLSMAKALLRWLALQGLPAASAVVAYLLIFDYLAKTPTDQWLGVSSYGRTSFYITFGGIQTSIVSWAGSIWALVLLATTGTNAARRGLHDLLAGSVVISPIEQPRAWPAYPYPPQAPYLPQSGGPAQPGYPGYAYPPQANPYWPPQGSPAYPYPYPPGPYPQAPYPYPYPPQQPPAPAPPPVPSAWPPVPSAPPPTPSAPTDTPADPPPT